VSSREPGAASRSTAATITVTVTSMRTAPTRRTSSSSSGSARYSCASTAIDQNDRFGLGAATRFSTSRPFTTTDAASGAAWPGGGTTSHATTRLNPSAAK